MERTIIWRHIQKLNKKLWQHNLIGIALLLGLGCSQYRYLYNCFLGTQKVYDLLFFLAGGLVLCSWNLYKAKVRTNNPRQHPIYSSLTRYGDGDLLAHNIDREIRDTYYGQELEANTLFVTPSWLLFTQIYNLQIIKLDRLMWTFKQVTNHSINFIPTGKSYEIVLYDSLGRKRNFSMSEREVDRIIENIHTYAPWTVIGYTSESRKMWDWRRKESYTMVERRQRTSQSRSGTAHAAPKHEDKPKVTVTIPKQEDKPKNKVTSPDRRTSSNVRPDLNIDLNLGFYEAIFGCEPDVRVNRLEIQSNGEFAPTVKQLKIVVPAGAKTGTRLRITGQGNLCTYGDKPGDLYLHLRIPFQADGLTREDDDIFTEVKITPAQAHAGVKLRIRTLDGDINLQIPPDSKHRSFLTFPGGGVPKRVAPFGRGDLVVWIEIESSSNSATPKASADFDNINSRTPKASADFDNIKSSLDGLAQLGWLQEESSWSANFTLDPSELSDADRLDRAIEALLDRARRVAPGFSVPMMVPSVVVESMPAAAGQFEVDEEGWVTIRVSPDFERDLPAARAILAHEVCHYILENSGIRQPNFELNERDTDLCMFICGFGDVFLAGYKRPSACNEYRPGHRLGYLTDAEYEFANRYTRELRATYRQNLQSELDVLKERLLRKAQGDRDRVRRLIEYERQRDRSLSEIELYRDAIARFDRD